MFTFVQNHSGKKVRIKFKTQIFFWCDFLFSPLKKVVLQKLFCKLLEIERVKLILDFIKNCFPTSEVNT